MDESSFYSIDRLVEFGLSLAVATQMASSMNETLRNTQIPGARNPMQPNHLESKQAIYYVAHEGKALGPISESELSHLISEKRVCKETYVWQPGMPDWQLAENVPAVLRLVALTPPPIPSSANA